MKEFVRTIPDYPIKGVQFRDITTLLQEPKIFKKVIDEMTEPWIKEKVDAVLSIESRGFIMAGAIAYKLDAAFVPLRKPNKLPYNTHSVSFELEYGKTEMHIHTDALDGLKRLLIIDDLLATGGTAIAALELIEKFSEKEIIGSGFIINLPELKGEELLIARGIKIHSLMEF
tara:strand:+ start:580 stop:1095 length:516 start_codon:yes stop_codon:yes gene_type:complete